MSRELNKIFDVKTREARRRILDKFDISNEDKNEVLNKIEEGGNSGGSGSENMGEFVYLDLRGLDLGTDMGYYNVIANSFLVYFKGETLGSYINGVVTTGAFFGAGSDATKISACAVCESSKILGPSGYATILEMFELYYKELYNSIPRITKEEFYSLEISE